MDSSAPVAVVTGAARGIGAATALRLAADGYRLVLVDRCADDPHIGYPLATRDQLAAIGRAIEESVEVVGDVCVRADVELAAAAAIEHFGRIDVAVACAGVIGDHGAAWEQTEAQFNAVVSTNLSGVANLAAATLPTIRSSAAGRGRFVAVASAAANRGMAGLAAYNAAKAGVVGLVRGLAADLGDSGVTANVVSPGSVRTRLLDASAAVYGLTSVEEFAAHHMNSRLIEPAEVADVIAWLVSERAAAVTAAEIAVDGGMTAK